jgi:hypothetical protein
MNGFLKRVILSLDTLELNMLPVSVVSVVLSLSFVIHTRDEADLKPDVAALEKRFKVVKQRYNADKRQYVLQLEAKETSDDACHYEASFQDADDKELRTVKLEFDHGGRGTSKGEKYTATIKYPTKKGLEKVTQLVIKKSD